MQKNTNVIPNSPARRRTPRVLSKLVVWVDDILGVREQEECVGHEKRVATVATGRDHSRDH